GSRAVCSSDVLVVCRPSDLAQVERQESRLPRLLLQECCPRHQAGRGPRPRCHPHPTRSTHLAPPWLTNSDAAQSERSSTSRTVFSRLSTENGLASRPRTPASLPRTSGAAEPPV